MKFEIDTFEAAQFGLSLTECAVFSAMRVLIGDERGAIFFGKDGETYKWLHAKLILSECSILSFNSPRQLNNVIAVLVSKGLLVKQTIFGKPCYRLKTWKSVSAPRKSISTPEKSDSAPQKSDSTQQIPTSTQQKPASTYSNTTTEDKKNNIPKKNIKKISSVPSADEVKRLAIAKGWEGFDVRRFLAYNNKRGWAGVASWQEAAERWHEQDENFNNKALTYEEYVALCYRNRELGSLYHHCKEDGLFRK